ncbi:MAG: hypothetical protein GTO02_09210, partial [Candidatus Dadabacteria bacterium]|nr:hypothetical protein [Candidatus Dadabacteria bacterium]NIQ14560.1 hypothetical protein [Candidatus Dadabacteria bacterium]
PGVKRVVLSYDFPLNKSRNIADINSDYLIKSHIVLIKKDIFDAEVLGLDKLGEMVVYNEEFVKYEGNNLLPGEGVKLVFKKRVDLKKYNNYIPVAIFTVFIITGLIYMNLRKKKVVPENDVASLNKDELLKEIAKLDDLYESKGIDESEYKNKRSILKEKLISLYSADDQ